MHKTTAQHIIREGDEEGFTFTAMLGQMF